MSATDIDALTRNTYAVEKVCRLFGTGHRYAARALSKTYYSKKAEPLQGNNLKPLGKDVENSPWAWACYISQTATRGEGSHAPKPKRSGHVDRAGDELDHRDFVF